MIVKNRDFTDQTEKADGGLGNFLIRDTMNKTALPAHVQLVCEVEIGPGEECRLHEHNGDSEIYYILSGQADYSGNGESAVLNAGDLTCCYDGEKHSIKCHGDVPLKFLAFIVNTK